MLVDDRKKLGLDSAETVLSQEDAFEEELSHKRMTLKMEVLSPYDLSCWWDVKPLHM